jgi:Flp pilus assembly protein TadG
LRRLPASDDTRGQSLVELAIILPILLFMAIAVFDFARVFTAAITIEAAAREAADFGGLYPWHWDTSDPNAETSTAANMVDRACTAASTLNDYVGDDPDVTDPAQCTNPTVTYVLHNDTAHANCFDVPRDETPCRVEVRVEHDFQVIVPLRLNFGGTVLGLPNEITLSRVSTFAISNFELDEDLAP